MTAPDDLHEAVTALREEIVALRRDMRIFHPPSMNFMLHASRPDYDFMGYFASQSAADDSVTYTEDHDERDYEINGGSK
jgi:hypothetical protein